jgi:hypothetical protein
LFSHQRQGEKEKKEFGDSSVNGICGCGLPANCCQPAVAGDIVYADLWGELSTHLAPQALFVQSSPVREPLLQTFPFPNTGKGDTAPMLSGLCVYLQFMWEVGLPPSPVKFSSHCHFHKLSCSCLLGGAAAPASCHVCLQFMWEVGLPSFPVEFSSLCHSHKLPHSWLLSARCCSRQSLSGPPGLFICSLFTVSGRVLFPQSSALRAPHPLSSVSLLLLLLVTQFLFFPQVEVSLSRGLCSSGPGLSVGLQRYHEAHLVHIFPSHLCAGDWWPGGPPCFSV